MIEALGVVSGTYAQASDKKQSRATATAHESTVGEAWSCECMHFTHAFYTGFTASTIPTVRDVRCNGIIKTLLPTLIEFAAVARRCSETSMQSSACGSCCPPPRVRQAPRTPLNVRVGTTLYAPRGTGRTCRAETGRRVALGRWYVAPRVRLPTGSSK